METEEQFLDWLAIKTEKVANMVTPTFTWNVELAHDIFTELALMNNRIGFRRRDIK